MHRLGQDSHGDEDDIHLSGASGRKGSKKVRSGCITCKIRKVKCDEAKPYCLRCSRTGRKCDGYLDDAALSIRRRRRRRPATGQLGDSMFGNKQGICGIPAAAPGAASSSITSPSFAMPIPRLPDLLSWDSAQERRSFDFFQHITAPMLAGDLDAVFWRVLVLQICHTEPAVRHAILAISSLHEALHNIPPLPSSQSPARTEASSSPTSCIKQQEFALQQYNKAIACLLEDIKMENGESKQKTYTEPNYQPRRLVAPVMTCLLFVCIEVMQGKDRDALIHLEQVRHLLGQLVSSQHCAAGDGDSATTSSSSTRRAPFKGNEGPEITVIRQHLVPLYTRLTMTSFLFGGSPKPIPSSLKTTTSEHIPAAFDSIQALRAAVHNFVDDVSRFTQRARSVKFPSTASQRRASSYSYDSFRSATSSYSSPSPSSPLSPSPLTSMQSPTSASSSSKNKSMLPPDSPQTSISLAKLQADKETLSVRLGRLRVALSLFRVNQSAVVVVPANSNTAVLTLLQIHLCISEIWLATALTRAETAFDAYVEIFSTVVSLSVTVMEAEQQQQQQKQQKSQQQNQKNQAGSLPVSAPFIFTLETQIIPALYYVATKCRHGPVRHAALSLLRRNGGRRENLWRADVLGSIAARIIEIEEEYVVVEKRHLMRDTGSTHAGALKEEEAQQETVACVNPGTCVQRELSVDFGLLSVPETYTEMLAVDLYTDPLTTGFNQWGSEEQLDAGEEGLYMNNVIFNDAPSSGRIWQESVAEADGVGMEQFQAPNKATASSPSSAQFVPLSSTTPSPDCPKHKRTDSPFDIPEQARVHTTVIGLEEAKGRWVTLFRKLDGLEGAWDVRTEFVSS